MKKRITSLLQNCNIPEWVNYIAANANGDVYGYQCKPSYDKENGKFKAANYVYLCWMCLINETNWKNTLMSISQVAKLQKSCWDSNLVNQYEETRDKLYEIIDDILSKQLHHKVTLVFANGETDTGVISRLNGGDAFELRNKKGNTIYFYDNINLNHSFQTPGVIYMYLTDKQACDSIDVYNEKKLKNKI